MILHHKQSLTADDMTNRYIEHLPAITKACEARGPFFYAVHENRIERLDLDRG